MRMSGGYEVEQRRQRVPALPGRGLLQIHLRYKAIENCTGGCQQDIRGTVGIHWGFKNKLIHIQRFFEITSRI